MRWKSKPNKGSTKGEATSSEQCANFTTIVQRKEIVDRDHVEQVRLNLQAQIDRAEQFFQQSRVDRSDQLLLWSQVDQSEKQFRQSLLEMQATMKNDLARHVRSVAEELGSVDRKAQADRVADRVVLQDLSDQVRAIKITTEEIKFENKAQAMARLLVEGQGAQSAVEDR